MTCQASVESLYNIPAYFMPIRDFCLFILLDLGKTVFVYVCIWVLTVYLYLCVYETDGEAD